MFIFYKLLLREVKLEMGFVAYKSPIVQGSKMWLFYSLVFEIRIVQRLIDGTMLGITSSYKIRNMEMLRIRRRTKVEGTVLETLSGVENTC